MSAPSQRYLYNLNYLVTGGGLFESSITANGPRGGILVFDISNFSAISSSLKFNWTGENAAWNFKAVDMSISGSDLVYLASPGATYYGKAGDGHHPVIAKYTLSATASFTFDNSFTWN